jgi:hypothetical protein
MICFMGIFPTPIQGLRVWWRGFCGVRLLAAALPLRDLSRFCIQQSQWETQRTASRAVNSGSKQPHSTAQANLRMESAIEELPGSNSKMPPLFFLERVFAATQQALW